MDVNNFFDFAVKQRIISLDSIKIDVKNIIQSRIIFKTNVITDNNWNNFTILDIDALFETEDRVSLDAFLQMERSSANNSCTNLQILD